MLHKISRMSSITKSYLVGSFLHLFISSYNYSLFTGENKIATVTFNGDTKVTIEQKGNMLNFLISVPQQCWHKTRGLLGVWNSDKSDDLTRPDGRQISTNSSERDIFQNFGQLWRTEPNASLFFYPSGHDWNDYQDASFVPFFSDEISVSPAAKSLCKNNRQCLFDYTLTGKFFMAKYLTAFNF